MRIQGVVDRTGAQALVGMKVFVERSNFPELEEGEFYCCDLLGMPVQTEEGKLLGRVREVLETKANDVLIVDGEDGEEILLPVIPGVFLGVEEEPRRVVVSPPEVAEVVNEV